MCNEKAPNIKHLLSTLVRTAITGRVYGKQTELLEGTVEHIPVTIEIAFRWENSGKGKEEHHGMRSRDVRGLL